MSREIKFQFIIDEKHLTQPYSIEEIIENGYTEDEIIEREEEGDCQKFENSKITGKRQFTGLTDDDDKEVFEGDILQFGAQMGSISEVKYIVRNAGFLVKDKYGDWQRLYNVLASTDAKVIGNIYENPELLSPQ